MWTPFCAYSIRAMRAGRVIIQGKISHNAPVSGKWTIDGQSLNKALSRPEFS
jgi:hypothetical protein